MRVPTALLKASLSSMQTRRKRIQTGCVFLDAKSKTWYLRYYVDGKRKAERIGTNDLASYLRLQPLLAN
jgi:hypothetical protein